MKDQYPIRTLCEAFDVSASGYYGWKHRQGCPAPRWRQDQELTAQIVQIHQQSRQTYGSPRIQMFLRQGGHRHGRNRIGRLMREQRICGRQRRRFRPLTTQSRHDQPIAPNRLAQCGPATGPNEIWVADITYIATLEGWIYLAAIIDGYSRRVVGWSVSRRLDTALVMGAWQMAVAHRVPPAQLIVHSDRGVQYASKQYRQALASVGAIASMSRKANCYDNAAMEAFWSTLKIELIYRQTWTTLEQVRGAIFEYIEVFYNRQRLHRALDYQSPAAFEFANN